MHKKASLCLGRAREIRNRTQNLEFKVQTLLNFNFTFVQRNNHSKTYMSNKDDKKGRVNVVYSTNPDFQYEYNGEEETETLAPEKQNLRVTLDSKQRKGKIVTLVQGFVGTEDDLKELAKLIKNKCGVGGSVKDGEIIIQGELKEKILAILRDNKYRAK